MAHFAQLDSDNNVVQVIVVSNDVCTDPAPDNEAQGQQFIANVLKLSGVWKQTSYNRLFRGNFAGPGMVYDSIRDAFIGPQPFPSWTLDEVLLTWIPPTPEPDPGEGLPYVWDEDTCLWNVPVAYPDDGLMYNWDEASQSWQEVTDGL